MFNDPSFEFENMGKITLWEPILKVWPDLRGCIGKDHNIVHGQANWVEDPWFHNLIAYSPSSKFGIILWRRFDWVIDKAEFVLGLKRNHHGMTPHHVVVTIQELSDKRMPSVVWVVNIIGSLKSISSIGKVMVVDFFGGVSDMMVDDINESKSEQY